MDIHRFSSRKRKQVRRACLNCQKAHSGCGEQRPCPRCVKRKEEHKCLDAPRRKRKDLPEDEEEEEEMTYNEPPAATCNKRKLEQAAPQSSAAMATRNAALVKTERHRHPHADTDSHDEDYEDDCCSPSSPVSTSAALVVRNTKRPRRASRWPSTPQPTFSSNNTLSFPFDLKQEKDEELATGYGNNNQHNNNNLDNLGVMGQMQQQVMSQKLSFYHMQPSTQYIQRQPTTHTQQPTYNGFTREEEKNCNFIFNPTEFDCVPPQRPVCEPQQQQPQLYDNSDLSLEWLVPELNLWGTTTTATTTTISPAPYAWTGMPEQIPSSFLMEEGGLGSGEENPLFFSDFHTFEPLFSF